MNKIINIFGLLIAAGVWLGAGYFMFFYLETTSKMRVGIVITITMMLFLNCLFCIALKFAANGIIKLKPLDYLLTIIFGYFGCGSIRTRIMNELHKKIEETERKHDNDNQ